MNPFIPEEDKDTFDKFLCDNNLEPVHKIKAVSKPAAAASTSGGNKQETGHRGHVADIDKFLQDIDNQMDGVLEDTTNF